MAGVPIDHLRAESLTIPFRSAFRHASAERTETSALWVTASGGGWSGSGEGCPRPYVTGETMEGASAFVARHEASIRASVADVGTLRAWMAAHPDDLDRNPAAWCAVELALLDLFAHAASVPIEDLLGLPALTGRFQYTAILGDMGDEAFAALARAYREQGFTDVKVKLSGELARDRAKLATIQAWPGVRVRVDANNLWRTAGEAIAFLRALDGPLWAVEEPVGAGDYAALAGIADALGCRVVLDESLLRASQIADLPGAPARWVINVRVSKMGGLLRSLAVVERARTAGLDVIVGAQVGETSLLTRAGLTVAQAARGVLAAQEGAFGTRLLERDVCDPPLMFGPGGALEVAAHPRLARPGFGVTV